MSAISVWNPMMGISRETAYRRFYKKFRRWPGGGRRPSFVKPPRVTVKIVADVTKVHFPKNRTARVAMRKKIEALKKNSYIRFATRTVRCLNNLESPGPDAPPPPMYEQVGFWHDCLKRKVKTGEYDDVILFASKAMG